MISEKINTIRKSEYISFIFRIVVGLIFFYAGIVKISFPGDFALSVQNYQMVPLPMTNLIAILIPWIEIICGIFIIFGFLSKGSPLLMSVLVFIFIIALTRAWILGLDIECGCFGKGSNINLFDIGKDILLLLLCLHILKFPSSKFALDRLFKRLP